MAAGTDPADLSNSSGGSDLEEGEFVAGPDLEEGEFVAGPDDDIRHEGDGLPEVKRRRLEDVVVLDGGAVPSPTPSRERDSDGTISDVGADAGAASLAQAQALPFPCSACRREFTSQKAASGHMSSHDPHGHRQGNKERPPVTPAVGGGWAVTGKRGSLGGRSGSSESEGVVDSAATVVSESVIDPMPIAFGSRSSSAEPNPPDDDSVAILAAPSGNPTSQAVVHPPCSRQFLQGQQLAADAARRFVLHQAAAPRVVAHHVQRTSQPQSARDKQRKEEGRDQRYATPQALGGHMVGDKFRQDDEASAAGLHLGVGDPKPAKLYPCKLFPSVFTSGQGLGGHMNKHPGGNVTPKKPDARPKVSARELGSALALSSLPMPPATMEVAPAQPAVAPSPPVVLRLFGVNIVVTPPAAATQEASSAVTETDQSSPASTNIEQ